MDTYLVPVVALVQEKGQMKQVRDRVSAGNQMQEQAGMRTSRKSKPSLWVWLMVPDWTAQSQFKSNWGSKQKMFSVVPVELEGSAY